MNHSNSDKDLDNIKAKLRGMEQKIIYQTSISKDT